jgi:hypothetical protein
MPNHSKFHPCINKLAYQNNLKTTHKHEKYGFEN